MTAWFPRPSSSADIRLLGASGELGVDELLTLLQSPTAVEWRDKVGVISPAEGSAKASTRLLASGGWVFKTDTGQAEPSRGGPQIRIARLLQVASRVEIWHPDKRWFLLRSEDRWWPVSVCPQLLTLRAITDWRRFSRSWSGVIARAIELSRHHNIGLDLGPANFAIEAGLDPAAAPIWYIDDELYPALELSEIAAAIVNRIPEQPALDDDDWYDFGQELRGRLEPYIAGPWQWSELFLQIGDVPLAASHDEARAALLTGLRELDDKVAFAASSASGWRIVDLGRDDEPRDLDEPLANADTSHPPTSSATQPALTAVLADVHGNLAALEAVIAAAEAEGVDSWLFLGDAVGYGPHSREVVARLASLPNFAGIRGNHDHMLCFGGEHEANSLARVSLAHARRTMDEAGRAWLMTLPVELRGPLADDDQGWLAVHGAPVDPARFTAYVYSLNFRANLEHLVADPARLCFHGHTHVPAVYCLRKAAGVGEQLELDEDRELVLPTAVATLVNPGSVGQPRDGDIRASFALWDRRAMRLRLRRLRYPLSQTTAAMVAAGLPDDLVARLEIGR
ncbi:MAG: metallophosphoesterase [Myxococcales bacterium]|nr:metallophosphoesterase [Myxococcales bacterium]